MVLVQNWPFFKIFFFGNLGQENGFFYNILQWKNAIVGFKNKELTKTKNWYVQSKGLVHGFGPKLAIFPSVFCLSNLGKENVFYDILERKHAFVGFENKA